jgi:hypothetical protein
MNVAGEATDLERVGEHPVPATQGYRGKYIPVLIESIGHQWCMYWTLPPHPLKGKISANVILGGKYKINTIGEKIKPNREQQGA